MRPRLLLLRRPAAGKEEGKGGRRRFRLPVFRIGDREFKFWQLVKRILPLLSVCALILCLSWLSIIQKHRGHRVQEIPLSTLLDILETRGGSVRKAIMGSSQCALVLEDGSRMLARWPSAVQPIVEDLWAALRQGQVTVLTERTSGSPYFTFTVVLMGAYLFMVYTMLRRMSGGGDSGGRWSDARRKVLHMSEGANATVTRFKDIAGIDRAKLEVKEVVDMMKTPAAYARLGARVPRGVLLVGPPGSGKTLLARACAAEAGVPFISAAATEFVELFVGRGAARVRKLFESARKLAPCIVFIDEVDALRARGSDMLRAGGHQEAEQTLNQLLACMDGLTTRTGTAANRPVVVMGATNRPEVLDEALLRPGRFDRLVRVDRPDAVGRLEILRVHLRLKSVPLAHDVNDAFLALFAERCDSLAGAGLEALVNEAAIRAARRNSSTVSAGDLEQALDDYTRSRASRSSVFPFI